MKVLVTGANGYLGQGTAKKIECYSLLSGIIPYLLPLENLL